MNESTNSNAPEKQGAKHKTHSDYINFLGFGYISKKEAVKDIAYGAIFAVLLLILLALMFAGLAV